MTASVAGLSNDELDFEMVRESQLALPSRGPSAFLLLFVPDCCIRFRFWPCRASKPFNCSRASAISVVVRVWLGGFSQGNRVG